MHSNDYNESVRKGIFMVILYVASADYGKSYESNSAIQTSIQFLKEERGKWDLIKANSNVNLSLIRYIMIAHNSIYQRVYKKVYVYTMIIFCWIFSYGFQLPTLFGVWGE